MIISKGTETIESLYFPSTISLSMRILRNTNFKFILKELKIKELLE